MDEDTLNAAMRILNMAKVLESHGKLNRLMDRSFSFMQF